MGVVAAPQLFWRFFDVVGLFRDWVAAGGSWWIVLGPIVMSALLIHYSGAGLMENTVRDRRPAYGNLYPPHQLFHSMAAAGAGLIQP